LLYFGISRSGFTIPDRTVDQVLLRFIRRWRMDRTLGVPVEVTRQIRRRRRPRFTRLLRVCNTEMYLPLADTVLDGVLNPLLVLVLDLYQLALPGHDIHMGEFGILCGAMPVPLPGRNPYDVPNSDELLLSFCGDNSGAGRDD